MALVFLPAADIPRFVGEGNVDLGITGQDMVAEASTSTAYPASAPATPSVASASSPSPLNGVNGSSSTEKDKVVVLSDLITEVLPLGFGKCRLQVQVPERSTHIKTVEDLVGKKIATSFDGLAGEFFGELDRKANAGNGNGEKKLQTKIEYVGGSVEAACALGLADGIVDLVGASTTLCCLVLEAHSDTCFASAESGETMRAAGLHAIHTVLTSQAVLIHSSRPSPQHSALIQKITARLAGVIAANRYVLCNYNAPRSRLEACTAITPGRRAATVSPLDDPEWVAVSAMVEKKDLADTMDRLGEKGATDILVIGLVGARAV